MRPETLLTIRGWAGNPLAGLGKVGVAWHGWRMGLRINLRKHGLTVLAAGALEGAASLSSWPSRCAWLRPWRAGRTYDEIWMAGKSVGRNAC